MSGSAAGSIGRPEIPRAHLFRRGWRTTVEFRCNAPASRVVGPPRIRGGALGGGGWLHAEGPLQVDSRAVV